MPIKKISELQVSTLNATQVVDAYFPMSNIAPNGQDLQRIKFSNLKAFFNTTTVFTSTATTGTAPLVVASTTQVANLNASLLAGYSVGTSGAAIPALNGANTWSFTQTFTQTPVAPSLLLGAKAATTFIEGADAVASSDTDTSGASINIRTGLGTGTAQQSILLSVADPVASGSTQQTRTNRLTVTYAGISVTGNASVSGTISATNIGSIAAFNEATVAEYRAATANKALSAANAWAAADYVVLTDAATVAVDMATFVNATLTLAGNRTLGLPTNTKAGQAGVIVINQDATGSRTLAYNAAWKFAGGTVPALTTTASARDLLFYQVISPTVIYATLVKAVA